MKLGNIDEKRKSGEIKKGNSGRAEGVPKGKSHMKRMKRAGRRKRSKRKRSRGMITYCKIQTLEALWCPQSPTPAEWRVIN